MKNAFFTLIAILAMVFAVNTAKADTDEIKAEFNRQQEICTENFVKGWLDQKSDKEMINLFALMVRANTRYSMACGGLDTSLTGSMIRAMDAGKTEREKFCLAICEYYRAKGINLDTRSNFNRGSFWVRN